MESGRSEGLESRNEPHSQEVSGVGTQCDEGEFVVGVSDDVEALRLAGMPFVSLPILVTFSPRKVWVD